MDVKSRDHMNIRLAQIQASMGKCERGKVGCVITKEGRTISTGYNGSVIPGQNCKALHCIQNERCEHSAHAEENAIAFAAKQGIALQGSILYVTVAPCYKCARLIVQAGIVEVVFVDYYMTATSFETDPRGIILLQTSGVIVRQFNQEKHF